MASSTRGLSTKLRRSELERALSEVEERYLDHHRALGQSEPTVTHCKDSGCFIRGLRQLVVRWTPAH
jgi:hypothetical protein